MARERVVAGEAVAKVSAPIRKQSADCLKQMGASRSRGLVGGTFLSNIMIRARLGALKSQ